MYIINNPRIVLNLNSYYSNYLTYIDYINFCFENQIFIAYDEYIEYLELEREVV